MTVTPEDVEVRLRVLFAEAAEQIHPDPQRTMLPMPRPRRPRRRALLIPVAAAVAFAAALAGLAVLENTEDHGLVAANESRGVTAQGIRLTYVPDGFSLRSARRYERAWPGDEKRELVLIRGENGSSSTITVTRTFPDAFNVDAELTLNSHARRVEVRQHKGVLTVQNGSRSQVTLLWLERPGVTFSVAGENVSQNDVQAVAEGVVDEVAEDNAPPSRVGTDDGDRNVQTGETVLLAEGDLPLTHWRLVARQTSQGLCVEVEVYRSSGGGCGSDPTATRGAISVITSHTRLGTFAYGRVESHVARVQLRLADGTANEVVPVDAVGVPGRFYVGAFEPGTVVEQVIALDARGTELGRASAR